MKILGDYDIYARRGDTHGIWVDLLVTNPDGSKTVVPFVEGDTVRLSIKATAFDTLPLLQFTATEFEGGRAHFEIKPADTKVLSFTVYKYDIELEREDGYTKTIIPPNDPDPSPKFIVTEEIT